MIRALLRTGAKTVFFFAQETIKIGFVLSLHVFLLFSLEL